MKKKLFFAFVGAIALSGAVGITSCTDKDVAEVSPGYNSETGEVNVDFVFNVSTANEATTRMSAANTQATVTMPFRGISNAYLGAYSLADDGIYLTNATATETANNLISLGTVINAGKINNNLTAPTSDTDISHRVLQLSLQRQWTR